MSTLAHFVRFSTSSTGLERILRGIESVCIILASSQFLLRCIAPVIPPLVTTSASASSSISPTLAAVASLVIVTSLQTKISLTRRAIRLFRFVDFFQSSQLLLTSRNGELNGVETYLDIISKSCLGIWGLLESLTLLDLLQLSHPANAVISGQSAAHDAAPVGAEKSQQTPIVLEVWGRDRTQEMNRQAMVFWFLALVANVVLTGWKMLRLMAYKPVPQEGDGWSTEKSEGPDGIEPQQDDAEDSDEKAEAKHAPASKRDQLERERLRLKTIVQQRKGERGAWIRHVKTEAGELGWKLAADALDMLLPTTALGWLSVDRIVVGSVMFVTTLVTGRQVWKGMAEKASK